MKYIDSEKLIAEIKRRRDSALERQKNLEKIGQKTVLDKMIAFNLNKILSFITSLQQEQPEPTCKSCGFYENNCPFIRNTFKPYPNRICKDYTYSVMKEQEQTEVDFEKEIIRYQREDMDRDTTVRDVARHFYELGLNARKEE